MPTLLTMPVLQPLDPFDPQAGELLAASNAYMATLYPAESNHLDGPEVLAAPNVHFIGGWQGERLLACGAVKLQRDADGAYGEIKRVWVRPEARGQGWSRRIMAALHAQLQAQGVPLARLETGIHQPEALGLYRALGYAERPPFGDYRPDPLSLFMELRLGPG